ncbi:hypothetical protein ACFW1A_24840 [Kitasatospora sp. NPDC058965]|uniref:hypothetical protein n=1 Tax=Kitasatospora sp. NPDC058965 TaxID=3346682 RepID=UPI0036844F88
MEKAVAAVESDLIDLSGTTIDSLRRYESAALATVIDGLLRQLYAPGYNIGGFNTSDSPDPDPTGTGTGTGTDTTGADHSDAGPWRAGPPAPP